MKEIDIFEFVKANKNCDECDHENEYVCFDCEREQVKEKYPNAKLHTIQWFEWTTYLLDPLDPLFQKIADIFLAEQHKRFGTDHFYAADTFIEMTPPSGELDYLADMSNAIYNGMGKNDPDAVWVLQTWIFLNKRQFWTQPRIQAFLEMLEL